MAVSPDLDCGACVATHPYRLHASDGGPCRVALCGCQRFEAAAVERAARCVLYGRLAHATGRCPSGKRLRP